MKRSSIRKLEQMTPAEHKAEAMHLYDAVQRYVEAYAGKLVVVGGISIQKWPQDTKSTFFICVKCLGRPPVMPNIFPIGKVS